MRWLWCICVVVSVTCQWCAGQGRTLHVVQQPRHDLRPTEQFRSLQEVASIVRAGDRVIIHGGIYREAVRIRANGRADAPIRFESAPFEQVILTGADRIDNWTRAGDSSDLFVAPLPQPPVLLAAAAVDAGGEVAIERLLLNAVPLREVHRREDLADGTFYVDAGERQIYVRSLRHDLTAPGTLVERVERSVVWDVEGDHVRLRGLRFRHNAPSTSADAAALRVRGDHAVIEDCIFEQAVIGAAMLGDSQSMRRCRFENNEQLGLIARSADGLRLTDLAVTNNGAGHTDGGGVRILRSRQVVIDWSRIRSNFGPGLVIGDASEQCIVQDSLLADNRGAGVVADSAFGVQIEGNVILANGLATTGEAPMGRAGVVLSSSVESSVRRNLILGNAEGVAYVDRPRQVRRIDGDQPQWIWPREIQVRNNTIAHNRDAQIAGWFDVADERNWPARMQVRGVGEFRLTERGPVGLSLESMQLVHESNVYAVSAGQRFATWGMTGRRQKHYASLGAFRADLELEDQSLQVELPFAGPHELDLRLPRNSPAMLLKAYPAGEVPGVRLGVVDVVSDPAR